MLLLRAGAGAGQAVRRPAERQEPGPVARPAIDLRDSFTAAARAPAWSGRTSSSTRSPTRSASCWGVHLRGRRRHRVQGRAVRPRPRRAVGGRGPAGRRGVPRRHDPHRAVRDGRTPPPDARTARGGRRDLHALRATPPTATATPTRASPGRSPARRRRRGRGEHRPDRRERPGVRPHVPAGAGNRLPRRAAVNFGFFPRRQRPDRLTRAHARHRPTAVRHIAGGRAAAHVRVVEAPNGNPSGRAGGPSRHRRSNGR